MANLVESLVKIRIQGKNLQEKRNVAKSFPESAGVYVFFKSSEVIYIGKAINLKRRVLSYFDLELETKTAKMVSEAESIAFIKVISELEALLLEARLIRKYMPRYNIAAKDDKHPLYIVITKEKYPRIITVRKIDINKVPDLAVYGPFPASNSVRSVLKMLRRIFPYSDHKIGKRGCLYSHIGLCDPCPSEIEQLAINNQQFAMKKQYVKNIRRINAVLSGKFDGVRKDLTKEMDGLAREEKYEEAAEIRNKIRNLDYITQPQMPTEFYMQNPNLYEDIRKKELSDLKKLLTRGLPVIQDLNRIECYDIAHLSGTNATASMVTFIDGEADKNLYRHFKIKKAKGGDDYDSMREVARRRLKHMDDPTSPRLRGASWGKPDLIIVDGGLGQVKAFTTLIRINVVNIPIVGIAKNPDRLIVGDQKIKLSGPALNLVSRVRDEAHRFARRYHHALISKSLINENNS